MALPQDVLSTESVPAAFLGGRSLPVKPEVDYETGGIAIQDPTQGLLVQVWRTRILNNRQDIVVDAEFVPESNLYSGTNITEVSLSFDQNMRPAIAFVEDGTPKLNWFDTVAGMQVTTDFPGIVTPKVSLDDKRSMQNQISDVIFAYLRSGNLYYRQQRDRYQTEYLLASGVGSPGLIKIGMNRKLRMQFMLKTA